MRIRSVSAAIAAVIIVASSVAPAAAATPRCDVLPGSVVSASEVVKVATCKTQIVIADSNGPGRAELPPPGYAVTFSAATVAGTAEVPDFTVYRSPSGEVATRSVSHDSEIVYGNEQVVEQFEQSALSSAAATSPKCDSFAYSTTGQPWRQVVNWYYKTPPFGGLPSVAAAMNAMADGVGACGQNKPNGAAHLYKGLTSVAANQSGGTCLAGDLMNVVDSAAVLASTNTLAQACTYRTQTDIVHSDMRISTAFTWYTGLSTTGCTGAKYDLQGVMTHESGHLFGLNHVPLATEQVMKPESPYCQTSQRKLGNGDLAGMKYVYP